jgi:hypothetical protein
MIIQQGEFGVRKPTLQDAAPEFRRPVGFHQADGSAITLPTCFQVLLLRWKTRGPTCLFCQSKTDLAMRIQAITYKVNVNPNSALYLMKILTQRRSAHGLASKSILLTLLLRGHREASRLQSLTRYTPALASVASRNMRLEEVQV